MIVFQHLSVVHGDTMSDLLPIIILAGSDSRPGTIFGKQVKNLLNR